MTGYRPLGRKQRTLLRRFGLILLLLVAFTLRVWNLNWDEGTHQHPDERYWSIVTEDLEWAGPIEYFSPDRSGMNPYNHQGTWVYGTLPLFATKAAAEFLESDSLISERFVSLADQVGINLIDEKVNPKNKAFNSGYEVQLVGRLLSALLDTGTVLLAYLLGKALFNRPSGFFSALLLTFTPLHLQYSHFHGAEIWATFFATAVILMSSHLYRSASSLPPNQTFLTNQTISASLFIGALTGMGAASKFTVAFVIIAPVVVLAVTWITKLRDSQQNRNGFFRANEAISLISITGLSAILSFRIFQPYAFDGLGKLSDDFLKDLDYLNAVNSGGDYPWVVQWVGRSPFFYPFKSIFWSGMGPALSIIVCIGLGLAIREVLRKANYLLLAPLCFVILMFMVVSQQFNPLNRYLLPIYPTVIVFAGYGIFRLLTYGINNFRSRGFVGASGKSAITASGLLLCFSVLWGVGFINGVYNSSHPRIEASIWIHENIPEGSNLTSQLWDDRLPIRTNEFAPIQYEYTELDLFRPDNWIAPETGISKTDLLISQLNSTDYIIESSNRIYDSVKRMPAEYPVTTAYYRKLFAGDLGYRLVASFENSPSIFGLDLPTLDVEETFSVYDHPTVSIWEKTSDWDAQAARKSLNPYTASIAPNLEPKLGLWNALLLESSASENLLNGPTFTDRFSQKGLSGSLSWLWWFLWIQLAAFLVLPWSLTLFSSLKDNGYGLSKVIGFISTGLLVWLAVSWNFVNFTKGTCAICLLALGVLGGWSGYRNRKRLFQLATAHRKMWFVTELIFIGIFFLVLMLRYMNPDLWDSYSGGEKPMELGYLTAIGRTSELPPYDPWFAGGVMNYYYFGWFLLSVPMLTLGILPEVAFQLGIATFVALAAISVWTFATNLFAIGRRENSYLLIHPKTPLFFGLFAISIFGIFGTFDAIRQHHDRLRSVNSWNSLNDWPIIGPVIEFLGGLWAWINGSSIQPFDWWGPSRVNTGNFDITEFPFFTFLFGDLHPHLMGLPIFLLVLCLGYTYVLTCMEGKQKKTRGLAAMIGATVGVARMTNTWDFPTLALISILALMVGAYSYPNVQTLPRKHFLTGEPIIWTAFGASTSLSFLVSGGGLEVALCALITIIGFTAIICKPHFRYRILIFLRHLLIAIATHLILIIPFVRSNQTFNLGLHGSEWVSPFSDFIAHWGLFLFIAGAYFVTLSAERQSSLKQHLLLLAATIGTILLGATVGWSFATCITWLGASSYFIMTEARTSKRNIARLTALFLYAFGFMVLAGPEIITINNDVARMNTVFKFWLQGWTLLSVASAIAAWEIWLHVKKRAMHGRTTRRFTQKRIFITCSSCILIIGLVYPLSSISPRLNNRFSTEIRGLNGLEYLEKEPTIVRNDNGADAEPSIVQLGEDLGIIRWLRGSVKGSPTIVEWTGDSYDWNGRISIHTGLPTVLGWSSHQRQQRLGYQNMISQRKLDVQRLYQVADSDFVTEFFLTYGVKYLIVGTQEKRFGNEDALRSFQTHPGLNLIFDDDNGKVYLADLNILWALQETSEEARSKQLTDG